LKFRPFDKVERCFDIVASVDRALVVTLLCGLSDDILMRDFFHRLVPFVFLAGRDTAFMY